MPLFDEEEQIKKLKVIREKEEEEVTRILADKYDLPYANLSDMSIELDYLKLIPEDQSHAGKIVVFQGIGKKIDVGLKDPDEQLARNIVKKLEEDYDTQLFLVSSNGLKKAWQRYKEVPSFVELSRGIIDISAERVEEIISQTTSLENLKDEFMSKVTSKEKRKVSELLEIILGAALALDASDIHIEPQEKGINLRFRLDGVLHDVLTFDTKPYQLLLSRIKLVSEMKLNIKEKPQDGRFTIKTKNVDIEVRSSALPGPYGETIVLRALNPKTIGLTTEDLGMRPYLRDLVEKEIHRPNGMILTTGPTGSGKTTTLYAFLKKRRSQEVKIITIENPIEYHLADITQTQTNDSKGYSFASGLRSILRQDPDIIMVGEIRDLEAASIALNAALTGHLVFSTLHTNDAAGTIPRLLDLGANPAILAPAINLSIAQRLLRKLCQDCRETYEPSKEELEITKKIVESFPPNEPKPNLKDLKLFKPGGCAKCSGIGYKGRIGIFEAILVEEKIEQLILRRPSETEIKLASKDQGILTMGQDAILKIIEGQTSFLEAQRVIELS